VTILLYVDAISGDSTAPSRVIARRSSTEIALGDVVKIEFRGSANRVPNECISDVNGGGLNGSLDSIANSRSNAFTGNWAAKAQLFASRPTVGADSAAGTSI
jgi:hypothetical protein